jgi:hypothetical protein
VYDDAKSIYSDLEGTCYGLLDLNAAGRLSQYFHSLDSTYAPALIPFVHSLLHLSHFMVLFVHSMETPFALPAGKGMMIFRSVVFFLFR